MPLRKYKVSKILDKVEKHLSKNFDISVQEIKRKVVFDTMNLQERIKNLNSKGITIKIIAEKANINKGTLYHYVSKQQNLSKEKQQQLLNAITDLEKMINNAKAD